MGEAKEETDTRAIDLDINKVATSIRNNFQLGKMPSSNKFILL